MNMYGNTLFESVLKKSIILNYMHVILNQTLTLTIQ